MNFNPSAYSFNACMEITTIDDLHTFYHILDDLDMRWCTSHRYTEFVNNSILDTLKNGHPVYLYFNQGAWSPNYDSFEDAEVLHMRDIFWARAEYEFCAHDVDDFLAECFGGE